MPSSKNLKPPKSASSSLAGNSDAEKQKVNLLDSGAVKRELDEATIRAAKEAGYQEDHYVSNVKILLGLVTCSIALIAQFYPGKHPDNWWLLCGCVIAYAACTLALNLFLLRFEGETFFFTRARRDIPALKFVAKMPRYSDKYTLLISHREGTDHPDSTFQLLPWVALAQSFMPGPKSEALPQSAQAEMTNSVTKYFHSDGFLNEAIFRQDVQSLLKQPVLNKKSKPL